MTYEFELRDKRKYFKNLLRTVGLILPTFFFLIMQFALRSDLLGRIALFGGTLLVVALALWTALQYVRDSKRRYSIGAHVLQVIVQYEMRHYLFSDLIKINRSTHGSKEKNKVETLILVFRDGKKIKLYNFLPFYYEFIATLAEVLNAGGYLRQIKLSRPLI
jgi:hypothetical protein